MELLERHSPHAQKLISQHGDIGFFSGEVKEKLIKLLDLQSKGKLLDIPGNLDIDPTDPE